MTDRDQEQHERRRESDRPFREQRWHFEKKLSLDTIVGILGVACVIGGPLLFWGRNIENRVQTIELVNEQRSRVDDKRDAELREQRLAIGSRLERIDDQVTQLRIAVGQISTQINKGEHAK